MLSPEVPEGEKLFRLDGRTAFVTGASGHLGSEMARALCEAGAHVILNGRNAGRLDLMAEKMTSDGHSVDTACFDIMDAENVSREMGKLKRLDVLINNAYTGRATSLENASYEDFDTAFRSGITAAFDLAREALPALEAAASATGHASVINISSMYGVVSPDPALYGASGLNSPPFYGPAKAALLQMTRYLAAHWAERNIRVNALTPGPFPTKHIQKEKADFIERLSQKNPMKRIGQATEIRGPVLFLASDAASFITGATIPVDGGWTAW